MKKYGIVANIDGKEYIMTWNPYGRKDSHAKTIYDVCGDSRGGYIPYCDIEINDKTAILHNSLKEATTRANELFQTLGSECWPGSYHKTDHFFFDDFENGKRKLVKRKDVYIKEFDFSLTNVINHECWWY